MRTHPDLLPALATWVDEHHVVLGDLGYEGETTTVRTPIKRHHCIALTVDQRTI